MTEDRLQVLDVDVAVEAAARFSSATQGGDNQCLAICHQTCVVAIANGRFVDLYGTGTNSSHPFTFLQQIALGDHVTHLHGNLLAGGGDHNLTVLVATCVVFPVPGFLLVGAFVEVPEHVEAVGATTGSATLLLGFRLYPGSASQFAASVDGNESRQAPASIQVYFSFVESVAALERSIRCLQPCRREMTPDSGSVVILFQGSEWFGVFSWKERFSDRQVCLARMKQQSQALVAVELSLDGRYLVIGDAEGRLSLLDFENFAWDGHEIYTGLQRAAISKRLELGTCSRSGVMTRDNLLGRVRLVHTTVSTATTCAYTSIRWWVCGSRDQQKQFILAGKQDGSLSVLKLIQENDEGKSVVELKIVQMYPSLASGTHDAVRNISEPVKFAGSDTADDIWFEFCTLSEMRWRTWRIKVTEVGEGSFNRRRMVWPSVKDSLDFSAFMFRSKGIKGIGMLPTTSEFSKLVSKSLADSAVGHTARYPISLIIADNRLQVIRLVTKAPAAPSFKSDSSANERDGCGDASENTERDEDQASLASIGDADKSPVEQPPFGPTTIQDKYRLPPMEWKTRSFAANAVNRNGAQATKKDGQEEIATNTTQISKLSRVDYNKRVDSVMQRVETLSGATKSMRTSFQLFSSDVQQHMNLVSEQLEELSRRRVTEETAHASRTG